MRRFGFLFILALLLLGNGCSLLPDQIDETRDWSAQRLYSEAHDALGEKNYERAIDLFEKLESRYPFGRYAQQALLESAYAYYKYDEPDTAIATLDRFIKTYPRHTHLDYALYLKGLVNFTRGDSFMDKILPRDPSERDAGAARQAFFDFQELARRFPDSRYAADARQRMLFLRNNLAWYEVHVAEYYIRRGAYLAAANRGQYVVEHYQKTPAVPKALLIMIDAYQTLGLNQLAADAERVYNLNYGNQ
jgi:outer membrane protein assembly factor BamD